MLGYLSPSSENPDFVEYDWKDWISPTKICRTMINVLLMLLVFPMCSWVQHLDPWSRSWWSVHCGWGTQQGRDCIWRPQGWIQWCLLHCPGAWWGFCSGFYPFVLMVGYKCLSWLLSIHFRRLWSIHQIQWWAHPWQSICGTCGLPIWWRPPSHCCQSSGEASRKTDICPPKTTPSQPLAQQPQWQWKHYLTLNKSNLASCHGTITRTGKER